MSIQKILSIEFIKLLTRTYFILFSLMILVFGGISGMLFYVFQKPESKLTISDFLIPNFFGMQEQILSFSILIFMMMNIGKEYTDKTLKKNIIDGYTRHQFFTGKLFLLFVSSLLLFVFGKIVLLTDGLFVGHFKEILLLLTPTILITSFMKIFSIGIFAFFLIFLTKNIVVSIVIYFFWEILEKIIINLHQLFEFPKIESYFPLNSMKNVLTQTETIHTSSIIIAVLYLAVMFLTSYYLLLKRDIH